MCLHCVKILMNLSPSECSGIFMQHQNRRTLLTVSSSSVRGGHTPKTLALPL